MTSLNRKDELLKLLRYKAWANGVTFATVAALPEGEALKPRRTRFGNILHTLNHIWVVEDIFKHHVEERQHSYGARNTDTPFPLVDLVASFRAMDNWWIDRVAAASEDDLDETIEFQFVGGGDGAMTLAEIVLHLVNHATYHRGFVGDMLYQAGVTPAATDFPVYLRDVARSPAERQPTLAL